MRPYNEAASAAAQDMKLMRSNVEANLIEAVTDNRIAQLPTPQLGLARQGHNESLLSNDTDTTI